MQSNYGANGIIYCGYHFDPETENYYVRNRYYSPALGRWITRDPIGYSSGINLYGYVGGMSAVSIDPAGECPAGYAEFSDAGLMAWEKQHGVKAATEWRDPLLGAEYPKTALKSNPFFLRRLCLPTPNCRQAGYCVRIGAPAAYGPMHLISHGQWHFLYANYKMIKIGQVTSEIPSQNVCQRRVHFWQHATRRADFLVRFVCRGYGWDEGGNRPMPMVFETYVYRGSVDWVTNERLQGSGVQVKSFDINPLFGDHVGDCG